MSDPGVAYPGPAPEALRFPFEEAQRAIAAMTAHAQAWRSCIRTHGDAAAHARVGFEGQVRRGFDQDLDDAIADVGYSLGTLEEDIEALQRLVRLAQARIAARNAQISAWVGRMNAYNDAVDAARRASYSA